MKEINIENINEIIYETILDNKFKIYLYPTNKSKNFYIALSTRFGANLLKYKKNNTIKEIYPGTAHFLEHKVANLKDEKMKKVEKLGSSPNAYTTYTGTTYEIYGSKDILTNIEVLFDIVFNFKTNEKEIESEKSIISEEIDMIKDDIYLELNHILNNNLFINSPYKHHILGTQSDINKIDKEYLVDIYNSFYNVSNMFVVVSGNFNKDEVNDFIVNYINKLKNKDKDKNIKPIKVKEPDYIKTNYIEKDSIVENDKVAISYKININKFNKIKKRLISLYIATLLDGLIGSTSNFLEKCKNENLIIGSIISYNVRITNNHLIIKIIANTNKHNEFIKELKKILKKPMIDEKTFNRKKKAILSKYILSFEDIEIVNMLITEEELEYNKFIEDKYLELKNINYNEFLDVVKNFTTEHEVIARLYKKIK